MRRQTDKSADSSVRSTPSNAGLSASSKHSSVRSEALRCEERAVGEVSPSAFSLEPPECWFDNEAANAKLDSVKEALDRERWPSISTTGTCGHIAGLQWMLLLAIDFALWFSVFFRDYQHPYEYNRTVSHFAIVTFMTDCSIFFVPFHRRHWFNPFRIAGAIQLAVMELQLWRLGVSGGPTWLAALRIALCLIRIIHAAYGCYRFGPRGLRLTTSVSDSPHYPSLVDFARYAVRVPGPPSGDLMSCAAFVALANLFACTHYNWGESRIDGPVTAFQAMDGPSAFLKAYVLEKLMVKVEYRAMLTTLYFVLLASQWPLMIRMFSDAVWPYAHVVAELGLGWTAFVRWRWFFRSTGCTE